MQQEEKEETEKNLTAITSARLELSDFQFQK